MSLLHALTVAVAGSSARKHRAQSLFTRLAALSTSSASKAVTLASQAAAAPVNASTSTTTPRSGLLRFLYEGCLFPSARAESSPGAPQASNVSLATSAAKGAEAEAAVAVSAAAVAESSLGPRCKKRETRRAAFVLLYTLCRGEEENLWHTFALLGGRDLVSREGPRGVAESASTDSSRAYSKETASAPTLLVSPAGSVGAGAGTVDQAVENVDVNSEEASGVASGEPWDYDPTSVLKESGQYVGLQNQVRLFSASRLDICLLTGALACTSAIL